MFDLEKLKNFDYQNIDYKKLLETLLTKKDLFASVIIGGVALVLLIGLAKNFFSQTASINSEISLLKTKIDVIADYESSHKQITKFLKSVPSPLDEDLFSTTIADMAATNNVTIVSFVPGVKKEEELSNTISAAFEIEVLNYQSLLMFLSALEKAPLALRVDNCVVTNASTRNSMMDDIKKNQDKDQQTISVHLDLSSVELKK